MKVIGREPSVYTYQIPRNIVDGKFRATFTHKGKMGVDNDLLYTPSP